MLKLLAVFQYTVAPLHFDPAPLTSHHILKASDRFNINSQLEHLQAKYVGTGHADLTRL